MSSKKLWLGIRLTGLIITLLFALRGTTIDRSRSGIIKAQLQGYEFNYVAWEVGALWQKASQLLFGYHDYLGDATEKEIVIDYLQTVGTLQRLEADIESTFTDPTPDADTQRQMLVGERLNIIDRIDELQSLAEPIIEAQVSTILRELGFALGGQVLPPVKFRFVIPPDILVISPRDVIQQDFNYSLRPLTPVEQVAIEVQVERAVPDDAARVTGIGGVGIYPAMVEETRWAAFAYEIVAHEWSHHYLFLYPSGQQYLAAPETRIINETAATVFGNAVGLMVLERFYGDEVALGMVWVPDYPTLDDFFPQAASETRNADAPNLLNRYPTDQRQNLRNRSRSTANYLIALEREDAAQAVLNSYQSLLRNRNIPMIEPVSIDRRRVINRTRITTDYLLQLGKIDAAEDYMAVQGQRLSIRRLNQAWFAFFGGYQADPSAGGGVDITVTDVLDPRYRGDPIGPAIQEIFERAPSPFEFLVEMRDITTRAGLLKRLAEVREKWE
jgi:hypothetical protein